MLFSGSVSLDSLDNPEFLLGAYAAGYFPMAESGEIDWYSPDPRGVIPLDDRFHVPTRLKRFLRQLPFEIRVNSDFDAVMRGCAQRDETWIDERIFQAYRRLHDVGHAVSIEAWSEGRLAGGLYGVTLGAAFFGESMFSAVTGASKVVLVETVRRLRSGGFILFDTQWTTPHLRQFGAFDLPRPAYLRLLARAIARPAAFPAAF